MNFIPLEIIEGILIRLPAISLLRFKAVCRSWRSLISRHCFIDLHSQRVSQHPKILFTTNASQFRLLDFESSSFDESCCSPPFDFPVETPDNFVIKILGSSCGLVCVVVGGPPFNDLDFRDPPKNNSLFLWNPSTRELRKIPDLSPSIIHWHLLRLNGHGFGYDPVSNDLKLVVAHNMYAQTFNVFSMKSNSWKSITCPGNRRTAFTVDTPATVVNGVFYWLDHKRGWPVSKFKIIAFDSKENKRLNLQLPVYSACARLIKHKECLCICINYSPEVLERGQIWMLKGHDWIHYLTVYPKCTLGLELYFWPICISKSSTQITFRDDKQLFVRLTKGDPVKYDKIPSTILRGTAFEATIYVGTLLSPNHVQFIGCTNTN